MDIKELSKEFQMQIPIKDNVFWNGKPEKWSNLKNYRLLFTQKFGMNLCDYSQFGMAGHNGIDIAGIPGTPIVAPCNLYLQKVVKKDINGYGLYIKAYTAEREINGQKYRLELCFGHFSSISPNQGETVSSGDFLGSMGTTGFSTGVHLHFGVRPWKKVGNVWMPFLQNEYLNYADPELFLPHIVWDYSELYQIDMDRLFYEEHDLKLIRNNDTGEIGWIYGGKVRTFQTDDRATLASLYYQHRRDNGITVNDEKWKRLDKEKF